MVKVKKHKVFRPGSNKVALEERAKKERESGVSQTEILRRRVRETGRSTTRTEISTTGGVTKTRTREQNPVELTSEANLGRAINQRETRLAIEKKAKESQEAFKGKKTTPEKKKSGFIENVQKGLKAVTEFGSPEAFNVERDKGNLIEGAPPGILPTGAVGAGVTAAKAATITPKSRAVVSEVVSIHEIWRAPNGAQKLIGLGVPRASRNFIGKPGKSGVNKLFKASGIAARQGREIDPRTGMRIAANAKTVQQSTTLLQTAFSKKAMAFYGAWASSVFLGRWAQAEAAEPISISLRDAKFQANQTGDWTIYDDYSEAANEITDPAKWRQIALWSPFAAVVGIQNKLKGVKEGVALLDALAAKDKEKGNIFRQSEGGT